MKWKVKLLLGVLGIIDTIVVVIIEKGVNLGIVLPALVGVVLLWWAVIELEIVSCPKVLNNLVIKRLVIIGFIFCLLSFVIIEGLIFSAASSNQIKSYNYLIVLGGGVVGEESTSVLTQRLKRSVQYIKEHPGLKKIIVTGGQGPLAKVPEAEVMKDFLVAKGIADDKIIIEDKASSTMENFKFSKKILNKIKPNLPHKVVVITSGFHLWRAKLLAARNGIEAVGLPAKTPYYILPNLALREYFAIVKSYVWDR